MSVGVEAIVTRVATSTGAQSLLSPGTGTNRGLRRGFCIYNESAAILYVKFGAGASATDYTVALPATTGYYEAPYGLAYQGVVSAALAAGTGNAQVTALNG